MPSRRICASYVSYVLFSICSAHVSCLYSSSLSKCGCRALARVALNDLVEQAWVELDGDIIGYKEYQTIHRGTFDQDITGMSRLVEQVTDLECLETEAIEGISKTDEKSGGRENNQQSQVRQEQRRTVSSSE